MFSIDGQKIKLTRGDTLILKVGIYIETEEGEKQEYTPVTGDSVRFALKRNKMNANKTAYADPEPLIKKDIPIDTMILRLDTEDTTPLPFGDYVYDIQITFVDGTVDTFIANQPFTLTPEVD